MKSIKYLLLALSCCLLLQCKKSNTDVPPPKVITGVYFPDVSIVKGGIVDHSDNLTIYGHVWDTIPNPKIDGTSPKSQYSYQGFNGDTLEVVTAVNFTEGTTYHIRAYAQDKFDDIFYGQYEIIYDPTIPANNPNACFATNQVQCIAPCTIDFDADCSTPETFISSYKWDFDGDGIFDTTGSGEQAVSHNYDSADTYKAILEIITITGVGSRDTIDIQVNALGNTLVACFNMSKTECDIDDCTISFDASCSQNETNYKWDFDGDGISDLGGEQHDITTYDYTTPGTYEVRLIVEDNDNNTDTTFQTIQVYDITADFDIPSGTTYEGCEVTFMNNSMGATSYLWDFGDGNTSTEENPTHIYNASIYTITLTATVGELEIENIQNITIAPTIKFENIRDIGNPDRYQDVIVSSDGGYVIVGNTSGQGAGSYDIYLIKTDANGNTLWERTFGGSDDNGASSIVSAPDGGYVIAGYRSGQDSGSYDVYLIKTDANGNMLWEKTFSENDDNDRASSIVSAPDGGYVIACYTAGWDDNVYLIKTDVNGNMLWEKTFSENDSNGASFSIASTLDGGYVIAGTSSYIYLIKTDGSGNMLWEKTFGEIGYNVASSIVSTPDGGYVIAGNMENQGAGWDDDVYLIKTDVNGNILWEKTFGGSGEDIANSIVSTPDGGYVVVGDTESQGAGSYDVYLIKTDANGNMLWEKTFGGSDWDIAYSVKTTNDCGYIIVGSYRDGSNRDFYLIKTDGQGNTQ